MTGNTLSEKALRDAAEKVRDAGLAACPESPPEHTFPEEFLETLRKAERKENRLRFLRTTAKRTAAAAAALVLCLSLFLTVSTEARASVLRLVHQYLGGYFVEFIDENWYGYLPYFEVTQIPQGMECIEMEYTYTAQRVQYLDPVTGRSFLIMSHIPGQGFAMGDGFELSYGSVNGIQAEIYTTPEQEDYCRILWYDDTNKIAFYMSSDLGVQDTLHIAESLVLSEYPN